MPTEEVNYALTETPIKLYISLLKAQGEFPAIAKNGVVCFGVRQFRYATLEDILNAVWAVLAKHDLFLTYFCDVGTGDANDTITVELVHAESGQSITSTGVVPRCAKAQDLGGWYTYLRRYLTEGILGIVASDDTDGPENPTAKYDSPRAQPQAPKTINNPAGKIVIKPSIDTNTTAGFSGFNQASMPFQSFTESDVP